MFAAARTLRWERGWAYLAVLTAGLTAHRAYVYRRNPELRQVRRRFGAGAPRWDLIWVPVFWALMFAAPVAAGLDRSRGEGWWPFWIGVCGFAAGMAISARAMAVNPHFEGTVRMQRDRAQRVIDAGPYAVIRHPGYLGLIFWALATPLLLGSWRAARVAVLTAAWVVLRTALEDRLLRRELVGYGEYAQRVRARLLPGLW
jgi:protein-S-isoprenylcysteine O-methyltransferase Ste14